nr:probable LRR receptor-like serine/threonine-protein kinase At3g47570 [Ipomoea batatas]
MVSLLNSSATLRDLVLSQCNFGGILPRYIGNFSRLRGLYLGGNVIHGDIPNEIQFLVHMEELEINGNQQTGIIPSSLGSLQSLIYLDLSENKLSGVLPSSLGKFSMLSELYLQSNNLQEPVSRSGSEILAEEPVSRSGSEILAEDGNRLSDNENCGHSENNEVNEEQIDNDSAVELSANKQLCGEYGMGSDLSTCGDMYSYGILLLEIFTGKSPTCDIFNNELTLHNYTKMAIPERVIEIVDPKLFHEEANATPKTFVLGDRILECLVSIFKIGIACSMELPRDRMNIDNAIKELRSIKDTLVQLGDISTIPRLRDQGLHHHHDAELRPSGHIDHSPVYLDEQPNSSPVNHMQQPASGENSVDSNTGESPPESPVENDYTDLPQPRRSTITRVMPNSRNASIAAAVVSKSQCRLRQRFPPPSIEAGGAPTTTKALTNSIR